MPVSSPRPAHNPALDDFRSLGILIVMATHFGLPSTKAGFLGVDVFFVLSGYLITSILASEWQRHEAIRFRRFYARRLLRLVPALCLMLIVCGDLAPRADQLAAALGLANYAMAFDVVPDMNQRLLVHTWSLASEWQYYLLWPPAFVLLMRTGLSCTRAALVVVGVALGSGVWRAALASTLGDVPRVQYGLDTRSDALLFGSALALILSSGPLAGKLRAWRGARPLTWLAFIATIGSLVSDLPPIFFLKGPHTLPVLCATLLLCGLLLDPPDGVRAILSNPLLVWIGKISYGLYLWHLPIYGYLHGVRLIHGTPLVMLAIVLTFAAASLSYYLIEAPALRLKTQFAAA